MKHLFVLLFILGASDSFGQAGEWTWMRGDVAPNSSGVFGTMGLSSPNNTPPALYGAVMWVDASNNIWLFGGAASYNTLWKYDIAINEWTWMNGSSINSWPGTYGTMGVPSPTNSPGARGFGFPSWKDLNGDFWIYGGDGYDASGNPGLMNDLWKYSLATNEWTWMNGSNSVFGNLAPVYGTIGVPDSANNPGSRSETTVRWVDNAGNLWFFGGFDNSISLKDDVWKYDITLNQWAWMAGSTGSFTTPVYGTMGVSSPLNTPGGRNVYTCWRDSSGNAWVFAGSINGNQLADLWKFDITSLEWTWMSGPDTFGTNVNAGAQCASDSAFIPASRSENRACWTDACGNFWLFGGRALQPGLYNFNDLWVYRPAQNDWTFSSGTLVFNPAGSYGTQGVSDPSNVPPGKFGTPGVCDLTGNFWVFGGYINISDIGNDLWRFVPDTTCPATGCSSVQGPNFFASDTDICEKFCINFFDIPNNNPIAWEWIFPGGSPSTSTAQYPTGICYNNPGLYDVTLITTTANGTDTVTVANYITVYATPSLPVITQVGFTLTSSPADSYQWQFNTVDIAGATNQSYTVTQTGFYTVIISDSNDCTSSTTEYIVISGIEDVKNTTGISIYPNPSGGSFTIELMNTVNGDDVSIEVVNTLGQQIFSSEEKISTISWKKAIELGKVARGIYFIKIKTKNEFVSQKIIIAD